MNKNETLKILAMLSAYYGQGKSDAQQMASAWHLILKDYPYQDAEQAVVEFARNDVRDYATFPTVGVIIREIDTARTNARKLKNKAWNNILNTNEYDKLIEEAKEWFSREQFNELKKLPHEIQVTQRDNFIKQIGDGK